MRAWGILGLALLLLSGCGDSNMGEARTAEQVCDEICGWPDACFVQLGVPVQGAECVQSCEAQADLVGVGCLRAISDTVDCLGTCDFESLTDQQILNCRGVALAIESACE
jgi:hypothetical protein